jgi:hypothetical protein
MARYTGMCVLSAAAAVILLGVGLIIELLGLGFILGRRPQPYLTSRELSSRLHKIPSTFDYIDPNLFFEAQRRRDVRSFPFPDFITGYEGEEDIQLEIRFHRNTCEDTVRSFFDDIHGTWLNTHSIVKVSMSALTLEALSSLSDKLSVTNDCIVSISMYIAPTCGSVE